MTLNLVLGRAGAGKTMHCLDEIRNKLRQSPEGHSLILIVPDHATFEAERELADTPDLSGFARVQVLGFRRLAQRILLETGGAVRPHITDLGKRLIFGRLLAERQGELKLLSRAAKQRSFADTLVKLVQEFKAYGIMPRHLAEGQVIVGQSPLADKLHDLGLLYQDFEEYLQGRYTDSEDYLNLLVEKVSQSALLEGAEVWVDGFSWFTPQEYNALEKILCVASSVTLTLCLDDAGSPSHERDTALFHRQWRTRVKLRKLAEKHGIEIKECDLSSGGRFVGSRLLEHIERQFFSYPSAPWNGEKDGLILVEAANRRVEAEGIARDIIRLCREEGYRWRDVAVVLRDVESYGDIIETVFADYDIPFFSDRKRPAVHHPLAELLRSVLDVLLERWGYEPLFRCLKTDLFPLTREEIDILENYVLEFGIRGSRWTNSEPWMFMRRLSLGEDEEPTEVKQEYLRQINTIRDKAAAPLLAFRQGIKDAESVMGITAALYKLLIDLDVPDRLKGWVLAAEQAGDLEQAREHGQIWNGVCELFDQMVETYGEQALSLEEYAMMLGDGLEGLQLSLVPPGLDHVVVVPLERARFTAKAVYVPGVNEGVLPMRGRDEGLLTDYEREQLSLTGLELAPGAAANTFAEQFLVYTALSRASHYLWVSYPLADAEGKALAPSMVIKRLKEITGGSKFKSLPVEPVAGTEQEYLAHPRRSLSALAAGLRLYKKGGQIGLIWWDVYNWALKSEELRGDLARTLAGLFHHNQVDNLPGALAGHLYTKNMRLCGSVTRFESYQACPFKHFARYGLGLKERAVFRLAAPDLGQFLHAALKNFGEQMRMAGRDWGSLSEMEAAQACNAIVAELAPKLQNEILLSSEWHKHLIKRLEHTVRRAVWRLIEFDLVSGFKPLAFEKTFGRGTDAFSPLVYPVADGVQLELVGQIDRLDYAEHNGQKYLLVIDYKSGGAWLRLPEVYYGLKLQLLTYLTAACKAGHELLQTQDCLPAGVLYYFLKNPSLSEQVFMEAEAVTKKLNSKLKMPGWVLDNHEIVRLMDGSIDGYSEFLKVGIKKDNTFYSASRTYLKSADEFKLLSTHVERKLVETAQQVLSGDISISPYSLEQRTACNYCAYQPVCQFDPALEENAHRKLPGLTDEEIMKVVSGEGGGSS